MKNSVEAEFYRSIMEQARDIILVVQTNGKIIDANQAAVAVYGYTIQELRNICIYNLRAPETHAVVDAQMKTAHRQGILFRTVHIRKNGERFPVEVSSQRLQCLDGEMLVSIVRNISEMTAMEMSMRESEKKYQELVEAANAIIMHLDEKGRILFANEFALNFFGFQSAEILNRSFKNTILPQYESTGRNLWDVFDDMFTNPAKYGHCVLENRRKDGRRVWIEWTNRFTKDMANERLRLITVGVDITARRRAEASLRLNYQRHRRNKLLSDLLENRISEDEFWDLASKEGLCLASPVFCSLVHVDFSGCRLKYLSENRDVLHAWLETAVDLIGARFGGVLWQGEQEIAIFQNVSNPSGAFSPSVDNLSKTMQDVFRGVNFVIGVSSVQNEIKAAYRQAREAVIVGPVFQPKQGIFYWRDLGMSKLVLEHAISEDGNFFIAEWLGPLVELPSTKNTELLCTLQELISGDPINDIAGRLHIHPKTVVFRKRKIEAILLKKLDDPETRLNIAVALKLRRLQKKLLT